MTAVAATNQWNRVTPRNAASQWLRLALGAIARLELLPLNWDGYGSPTIRLTALQSARRLVQILEDLDLPIPAVRPVTGGGISLTWQKGERELEIEILPDGSAEFLVSMTDPVTGEDQMHELTLPLEHASNVATWLFDD